jgi:hypothetical protein
MGKQYQHLYSHINDTKILIGQMLAKSVTNNGILTNIQDAEFKVFSQWGDDGIIQYLVSKLDISEKTFVEFGVSNYTEANTRFLLVNNNWSGLVMDCSEGAVNFIKNDEIYWKHQLTAKVSFITAEDVNETLINAGFAGEIGLLHIDVDGNDYWIWKALQAVNPVIAIIEYNSLFGIDRSITIPYDPKFNRFEAHHSGIYAGSSLLALCNLAEEKGYAFVGSNSAGNNAYFIRKNRLRNIIPITAEEGYVLSKFREHRDERGHLTFLPGYEAIKCIKGMKVCNTKTDKVEDF